MQRICQTRKRTMNIHNVLELTMLDTLHSKLSEIPIDIKREK